MKAKLKILATQASIAPSGALTQLLQQLPVTQTEEAKALVWAEVPLEVEVDDAGDMERLIQLIKATKGVVSVHTEVEDV